MSVITLRKHLKPIERITDTISEEAVENAAAMIKAAKKPYVFVGGGVIASDASEELKKVR